jgi:transcriptional regulator with XRE-family HTH domain
MTKRANAFTERNLDQTEASEAVDQEANINVGRRLREIRMGKGLSIRALADASELNVNTLSLIENGRTSPSVSTLQMLSQALKVPISTLFETNHANKKVVYQRSINRARAFFAHGFVENLGTGMSRFGAEPLIITLKPGADSGKTPIVHTGREFVYCIAGKIIYFVDSTAYPLTPGDSLMFEAYLPHGWRNEEKSEAKLLLVLCPFDERDQPSERHFGT